MPIGIMKWFNTTKGYGFIQMPDGGADVFVHISSLQLPRCDDLHEGQQVEFEVATGRNGKAAAAKVKLLG
jgi:CspA family cold shock protein